MSDDYLNSYDPLADAPCQMGGVQPKALLDRTRLVERYFYRTHDVSFTFYANYNLLAD